MTDSSVRAEIDVVAVIEGDRGPGFKAAANVMGAVGPKHVVDFTIVGFTVRIKPLASLCITNHRSISGERCSQ